ncbi:MAG TPA: hypothetical protein VFB74_20040, partial [Kribbellaceae bacterium]|nr:hypothetical protein [Kribbellaceae bacterium]
QMGWQTPCVGRKYANSSRRLGEHSIRSAGCAEATTTVVIVRPLHMGNAGEQGDPDGEPGNASEVVALSADGISATAEDE